jgi:hypothetical protein
VHVLLLTPHAHVSISLCVQVPIAMAAQAVPVPASLLVPSALLSGGLHWLHILEVVNSLPPSDC